MESTEAGDAEPGARGGGGRRSRQRKRPGPLAGCGCQAAAPGSQSPSQVSAAANLGKPGGGDKQRHTTRRSLEHGGDRRRAAGAGTLFGQRGRHPGPAMGACSGPGRGRGGGARGLARCLRPGCCAAHLRHFLAAAPQTLARAPGEREGGGRRAEGRGQARRSAPGLARLRPRRGSAPPCQAAPGAPWPPPRPAHLGRSCCQARPPPDTGRPARIPKGEVSIWDPQQVPGKQSRRSRSLTSLGYPPTHPLCPSLSSLQFSPGKG